MSDDRQQVDYAQFQFHAACIALPTLPHREFQALKRDIEVHGQHTPIIATHDQVIVDGRHRFLACLEIGREPVIRYLPPETTEAEIVELVASTNFNRRQLTAAQRVYAWLKLNPTTKLTNSEIAKLLGVSNPVVSEVKQIFKADIPAQVLEQFAAGKITHHDLYRVRAKSADVLSTALRLVKGRESKTMTKAVRHLEKTRLDADGDLPLGQYRVVVVDPPWQASPALNGVSRAVTPKVDYAWLSLDEVKDLKIPVASDAWVLVWSDQRHIVDALAVIDAWGVEYRYTMVWAKQRGYMMWDGPRSDAEFIIVGRVGVPSTVNDDKFNIVNYWPIPPKNTRPVEFYDLVESVMPGPRIDMFAHARHDGFTPWGLEVLQ